MVTLIWPMAIFSFGGRKWNAWLLHVAKETHIFKNKTKTYLLLEHTMMSILECSIVKTKLNNYPDWLNRVEEDTISKLELFEK